MDALVIWPGAPAASKSQHGTDELEICLCSLLRNAGFIDRIILIAMHGRPRLDKVRRQMLLDREIRLEGIPLKDLFGAFREFLPTHNPAAVLALACLQPDLGQRILYVPHNCMLLRPMDFGDFHAKGQVILRDCRRIRLPSLMKQKLRKGKYGPHCSQIHSARIAGATHYYSPCPDPTVIHRDLCAKFFSENGFLLKKMLESGCPGKYDIDTVALSNCLCGDSVCLEGGTHSLWMAGASEVRLIELFRRAREENDLLFCSLPCLQDESTERRRAIIDWASAQLGMHL